MTAKTAFSVFKEKYASNIRFWIVLFFVLRLYGITNPPIEIAHNWRQVTGDMVARNFYEIDNNILYPRLDIGGEKTGITGTEFPVLNYLMYLLSLIFGYNDWFGRLINLIVSSYGILYFYKLMKIKFDEKFSFYAAFVLLISLWLMFSRKTMPDTFSTSLVIISLYHAFYYFQYSKFSNFIYYFLFGTVAVLSKIPVIYLLIMLSVPLLDKNILLKNKLWILFASVLMLFPVCLWYFYWVPYITNYFGFSHYFMGTSFANGFDEIKNNLFSTFERFYFDAFKFIGFAVFVIGFILSIIKKEKTLLWILVLCSFTFGVFMIKAGRNFYHHSYYIIPFVPVMSLFVAYAIMQVKNKSIQIVILLAISVESIGNQVHDFRNKKSELYKLSLEKISDKISKKTDLIAINGGKNPQLMFFTHRKGWTINYDNLKDELFMNDIISKGCEYLFLDKHDDYFVPINTLKNWSVVFENEDFVVFSLRN